MLSSDCPFLCIHCVHFSQAKFELEYGRSTPSHPWPQPPNTFEPKLHESNLLRQFFDLSKIKTPRKRIALQRRPTVSSKVGLPQLQLKKVRITRQRGTSQVEMNLMLPSLQTTDANTNNTLLPSLF